MKEIIINYPGRRLQCLYSQSQLKSSDIAILFPGHPNENSNIHDNLMLKIHRLLEQKSISTLSLNFGGVAKSLGKFSEENALTDASVVADWIQIKNINYKKFWLIGFSFGSWVLMQLLMRRPEISNFICASIPLNKYNFSFINAVPSNGLVIHSSVKNNLQFGSVKTLVDKLRPKKSTNIKLKTIDNNKKDYEVYCNELIDMISEYINE